MNDATLRIVVVLYRSRIRTLRPLIDSIAKASIPAPVEVNVVINRDDLSGPMDRVRRVEIAPGILLAVRRQGNAGGVAAAYNLVLRHAAAADIFVLLDADGRMPPSYFSEVWTRRAEMREGLNFLCPELYSGNLRISPFQLSGIVPFAIEGKLEHRAGLRFADGIGVINSGLAGSVSSFQRIDGFSPDIGLDLSDIAWSLAAARRAATLSVLDIIRQHDLSIRSGGFTLRRLRKYLVACWRFGLQHRNALGGLRLAARGFRAFHTRRSVQ
jgi:GT2 family glycosyltransferase